MESRAAAAGPPAAVVPQKAAASPEAGKPAVREIRFPMGKQFILEVEKMNKNMAIWGTLAGFSAGAAAMYFLDPDRGARRRALVRDQVNSKALKASRAIKGKKQDLANRAYGTMMEAKSLLEIPGSEETQESGTSRSDSRGDVGTEARSH
jgi:gas vesicle protein